MPIPESEEIENFINTFIHGGEYEDMYKDEARTFLTKLVLKARLNEGVLHGQAMLSSDMPYEAWWMKRMGELNALKEQK